MLTLKNWYVTESWIGLPVASGIVYGHYRLSDGTDITTSVIQKIWKLTDEPGYVIGTFSGSLYKLDTEDMLDTDGRKERTLEIMLETGIETVPYDKIRADVEAMNAEAMSLRERNDKVFDGALDWAKENLEPGELYLIFQHMSVKKAIYKSRAGELEEVAPRLHVGTFQDSVLVMGKDFDFRYFPNHSLEPYAWRGELDRIHIYNAGKHDFEFRVGHTDEKINCEAGEVTVINKDDVKGEIY